MKNEIIDTPKENQNNSSITPESIIKNKNIKYPFSGIAPNLIDKFLVLGYEQKTIEHTYQCCNIDPKEDLKTRFSFYEFEERPSIVNEICNDYTKDLLDNDLILELVFPNYPQMYFIEKQYMNMRKEPDEELLICTYSIIFSINPQDNSGSKKSYNGLGYIFYIANEHRTMGELDGYLYVPIAYVILSEFPYFYHFNEICKNVFLQMKKENDEIPIDIILYNTVKYTPSPINYNINLSFGALFGFPQNKNNKVESVLNILNSISLNENKGIPTMFFSQLSGYPYMDLNISFIFNLIPPEIIVEVFIFSFLEHDIIFYSSRPEILNMVMYIFANLNYPFNDSIYYWHILSVSEDSFMSGSSTFVGKTCSTLTGILSEYDQDILTTKKIREHFVLDIDNKNFFFLYQEETEEVKDTMSLYTYIKNCAADADDFVGDSKKIDKETKVKNYFNDGIQLYEVIRNLMEELQRRAKKVTSTNYNERNFKPTFLNLYEDESEMECMKVNLRLQKAFFTFITQIMQNFVRIISIGEEKERNSYNDSRIQSIVINIKKEENMNEEEETKRRLARKAGRIFKEKFQDCSKYSSFVINFCKFHETIDLYKIPYTFVNEFVYYSHVAVRNNLSEVDVFKLIDQFYGKRKMIDFEDIINGKEKEKKEKKNDNKKDSGKRNEKNNKKGKENINEIIDNSIQIMSNRPTQETDLQNIFLFTFDNFSEFYQQKLMHFINRELEDDKDIFVKVKAQSKALNKKKFKRNGFYLSNKLLNIYTHFTNNNNDELIKLFQLIKCGEEKQEDKELSNFKKENNSAPPVLVKNENEKNTNNNIDYFYILREKSLLREEKMDKIERYLKLFGCYEFNEITDVIERHFILERCFTSYGLIKFSLLNVLAVTRGLSGQKVSNKDVITTMCDFCEKTKSLVRKYMNIFLNIFQNMKVKGILENTDECDECLNKITLYFYKTNMIPTEETTKAFNEIKETEIKNINNSLRNSGSINAKKANFEDFVKIYGNFFEIKDGLLQTNTRKKFEEVVKTIETIFSGIYKPFAVHFEYKDIEKLYEDIEGKKMKFIPKTPLSLYSSTNKILSKYLKDFSNNIIFDKELGKDILSLLYYFKIPIIGLKWIEQYKPEDKYYASKNMNKDKLSKKNKEPIKYEEDKNKNLELNYILKKIIAILFGLIKIYKTTNMK